MKSALRNKGSFICPPDIFANFYNRKTNCELKGWVSEQTWSGAAAVKVTRAQIQAEAEKRESAARGAKQATPAVQTHLDKPLEENLNRTDPDIVNASNVEDAIAALRYNSNDSSQHCKQLTDS